MVNTDNKFWLLAMELFDDKHITKDIKITNDLVENISKLPKDMHYEIRKIKALEIIAEELIEINNKFDKVFNLESGCIKVDPNYDV